MTAVDPLVALLLSLAVVGVLVLLLRWAFGSGSSLVARPPRTGTPEEYGLLVPVAAPADRAEAARLTERLSAAGIRHTLVQTSEGLRLLVWPTDEARARETLKS